MAEIGQWFSAPRQIRHADRRAVVFPQERETAVLDVPEADPTRGNGAISLELCAGDSGETMAGPANRPRGVVSGAAGLAAGTED
ncbi:hypothetical protein FRX94_03465 [Corynebacterium canis]|uniref:Uncharacterized protein n=1 Tax=Corynebacterium canis TaxID=679663 RepID=A0A5C5UJL3_9CORY|nr:hypothetical protein [Corynebacterium canis]TWT26911.1 hypothetical protein FRX94_03465 [Corynebacterium canis]WJY75539.1 hypothetical protein CCANI_08555 [Corynebacterium canis]